MTSVVGVVDGERGTLSRSPCCRERGSVWSLCLDYTLLPLPYRPDLVRGRGVCHCLDCTIFTSWTDYTWPGEEGEGYGHTPEYSSFTFPPQLGLVQHDMKRSHVWFCLIMLIGNCLTAGLFGVCLVIERESMEVWGSMPWRLYNK